MPLAVFLVDYACGCYFRRIRNLRCFALSLNERASDQGGKMLTKKRCLIPWGFIIIMVVGCIQLATTSQAQAPQGTAGAIGLAQRIQGAAVILHAGAPDFFALGEKDPTFLQDLIGTDPEPNTRLWWKGTQAVQADASLGAATALQFLGFERQGRSTQFAAQVGQGIVRFVKKLPKSTPPSSFAVFTPTALVAIIPTDETADFFVEDLDPNKTQITVNFGAVMVKNVSEQLPQQQILRSCQTVVVERDREPSGIMQVTEDVLRELINRTTIPGTLSNRVASCRRTVMPPEGPWYPDYLPEPGIVIPYGPGFLPPPGIVIIPTPTGTHTRTWTGTGTGTVTGTRTGWDRNGTGTMTGTTTRRPTRLPTFIGTLLPTRFPTLRPTLIGTRRPTATGTGTGTGTRLPTFRPTFSPTLIHTLVPTRIPTFKPTKTPSLIGTGVITRVPTRGTGLVTKAPTGVGTGIGTRLGTRLGTGAATHQSTIRPKQIEQPTKLQQKQQLEQHRQLQPTKLQQQQQLQLPGGEEQQRRRQQ